MKRVLVTGATGFIGRHALSMLNPEEFEIHAVATKKQLSPDPMAQWHVHDLLANDAPSNIIHEVQPTHLLHFAWIAEPGVFWTSPLNEEWKRASIELIDAFVAQDGERMVIAGTCAEYDWSDGHCIEDATPLEPRTLYGQCKRDVHLYMERVAQGKGTSAAWGHIFHLYGPYEHPKRLVPSVILGLLREERVPCTLGKQVRDVLHVEDVAHAFVTLLGHDTQGSVNIASDAPVSVRAVIEMIASTLEGEDLIDWGAIPFPEGEPLSLTAQASRLHDEIGWFPAITLEEGIIQTIDWWKNQPLPPA